MTTLARKHNASHQVLANRVVIQTEAICQSASQRCTTWCCNKVHCEVYVAVLDAEALFCKLILNVTHVDMCWILHSCTHSSCNVAMTTQACGNSCRASEKLQCLTCHADVQQCTTHCTILLFADQSFRVVSFLCPTNHLCSNCLCTAHTSLACNGDSNTIRDCVPSSACTLQVAASEKATWAVDSTGNRPCQKYTCTGSNRGQQPVNQTISNKGLTIETKCSRLSDKFWQQSARSHNRLKRLQVCILPEQAIRLGQHCSITLWLE